MESVSQVPETEGAGVMMLSFLVRQLRLGSIWQKKRERRLYE